MHRRRASIELSALRVQRRPEQRFLVGEVAVDRLLADTSGAGDRIDAHRVKTALDKLRAR